MAGVCACEHVLQEPRFYIGLLWVRGIVFVVDRLSAGGCE